MPSKTTIRASTTKDMNKAKITAVVMMAVTLEVMMGVEETSKQRRILYSFRG